MNHFKVLFFDCSIFVFNCSNCKSSFKKSSLISLVKPEFSNFISFLISLVIAQVKARALVSESFKSVFKIS
jgi:hypothetical protein